MTDEKKFEVKDNEEEYEELEENGRGGLIATLVIFIILFLVSTGLLFYYHFYLGNGKWDFTFQKRNVMTADVKNLENENAALSSKIDSLETVIVNNQTVGEPEPQNNPPVSRTKMTGTYYEVQIGAFQSFDPSKYDQHLTNLEIDYEQGMVKLTIGQFKDLSMARQFRRDIARMGIKDAFIVQKDNGKRVKIMDPM